MPVRNSQATREKILATTVELFSQKGFYNTSTLEIAKKAGIAEGTVFKHFGAKKNLLFALVDEINTEEISSLLKEATENKTGMILKDFLKKHKSLIQNNFPKFKVIIYEAQFIPELKEKFIEEVALKIFSPLENFINKKISEGEFKNKNPQIVSRAFVGMIISFIAWQDILKAEDYKNFEDIEVIEEVVEIFLDGIRKN